VKYSINWEDLPLKIANSSGASAFRIGDRVGAWNPVEYGLSANHRQAASSSSGF
jgi:hypothetical protein